MDVREIKFRAWVQLINKVCQVASIDFDLECLVVDTEELSNSNWVIQDELSFSDIKLMQYTGLKDKNGVDIYEGDIIVYGKTNSKPFYAVCIFENAKFQLKVYDTHDTYNDYDLIVEGEKEWVEVIGNIYENQELLNG